MRAALLSALAVATLLGRGAVAAPYVAPVHATPHHFLHGPLHQHGRPGAHRRPAPSHHARAAAAAAATAAAAAAAAAAAEASKPAPIPAPAPVQLGRMTGLPIPRFAALRSDEVNLRTGPGTRYPIAWVYKKRDLPVEIEREYDVWRLVEDRDGTRGWVHQATLIGTRTFVVEAPAGAQAATDANPLAQAAALRAIGAETGTALAYLKPGVIGRLVECAPESAWCHVTVHGIGGYLRRDLIWGLLPGEAVGGS